jgi:uncharacterized protein YbjT (DUF2867 family)
LNILVVGASGLIGAAVTARLVGRGDSVLAVSRRSMDAGAAKLKWKRLDIAEATEAESWLPLLDGIDAVVNCAGILQDSPSDSTTGVHVAGVGALYAACEQAGVRRVVHFSAVGVDRATPTAFSRTKLAGDTALMARDLDWVILRPSVVIGRAAYGASALIRGLAALPLLPLMPGTGPLQVVHLDDVVDVVVRLLDPAAPSRGIYDIVGPVPWTFADLVDLFRRRLGRPPAHRLPIPAAVATLLYRLGDIISLLGWRPPVRSTAAREIARGAVGDSTALAALGFHPRDIEQVLAAEPAGVQERWFAGLYIVKPVLFAVLSLFWLGTGLISLGPGWQQGMDLMREGGIGETPGALTVIAGSLADIAIGVAIAWRPTSRYGLLAAVAISLAYMVIGTILVPRLWSEPLGPMLKIWPIIVAHLAALAILEDR